MNDEPERENAMPDGTGLTGLERRRVVIAACVVGGVLLFFALVAVFIFVFRWQLLGDPWKVI